LKLVINDLINTWSNFKKKREKHHHTFFNDSWIIYYIFVAYIGFKKFGWEASLYAFLGLQILDIVWRVLLTIGLWFIRLSARILDYIYHDEKQHHSKHDKSGLKHEK
jgi:hypothetical protein